MQRRKANAFYMFVPAILVPAAGTEVIRNDVTTRFSMLHRQRGFGIAYAKIRKTSENLGCFHLIIRFRFRRSVGRRIT